MVGFFSPSTFTLPRAPAHRLGHLVATRFGTRVGNGPDGDTPLSPAPPCVAMRTDTAHWVTAWRQTYSLDSCGAREPEPPPQARTHERSSPSGRHRRQWRGAGGGGCPGRRRRGRGWRRWALAGTLPPPRGGAGPAPLRGAGL